MNQAIAVILATLLCIPSSLFAEKQKAMFEKDFIAGLFDHARVNNNNLRHNVKENRERKLNKRISTRQNPANSNALKIHSIGLIININQAEHFRDNIRKLFHLSQSQNLSLSKIQVVGNLISFYQSKTRQRELGTEIFELRKQNKYLTKFEAETLKELSYSPVWVIETEKGNFLLEGLKDPSTLINNQSLTLPISPHQQLSNF